LADQLTVHCALCRC